ncbi:MAG: hypothetical protein ABII64_02850 [Elusimicrobiota bacterium]
MGIRFHFLNVGSGNCILAHFPKRFRGSDKKEISERIMMIDICHHEDHEEYENVIEYYKRNFKNEDGSLKPIFRFVCTHPHQDHICGLTKFYNENYIKIFNFWDLNHTFEPENFDYYPTHEDDWNTYKSLSGDKSTATVIRTSREDIPMKFWHDDEDRITVLSPSKSLYKYAHYKEDGTKREANDVEIDEMSYAFLITINSRKVILAGDGRSTPFWDELYNECGAVLTNCSVLLAGHHGQESAFHEDAVKLMEPKLIIFSNSKDDDETDGAEKLYKKAVPDALILKTFEEGSIIVDIPFEKDKDITYWSSK